MYGVVRSRLFAIENFQCLVKMDEDQEGEAQTDSLESRPWG